MATEVIREFLVALGYKQDEAALKKFEQGITQATKAVFGLAAAVEGTAVLVAAGIARFASNLESLYFASQRVGSSAIYLRAFDRAAQDFGTSAGEAQASVEGLAHALRVNPTGMAGMLEGNLGVHLKHTSAGAIDTVDAMLQLSTALQNMPIQRAEGYLPYLGIDEKTMLAMRDPNFAEQYRKTLDLMKGADWQKAAENAHQFENRIRDMWTLIESIGLKVGNNLADKFGFKDLEDFNHWLLAHSDEIADKITGAIDLIMKAAGWLKDKFIELVAKYKDMDAATGGWLSKLLIIAGLLKVTGVGSIVGGLGSMALALTAMGTAGWIAAAGVAGLLAELGLLHSFQSNPSKWANRLQELLTVGPGGMIDKWAIGLGMKLGNSAANTSPRGPLGGPTRGVRNNNPGNLKFAGQAGALNADGFAVWSTPQEGMYNLGRQLELYGSRGINTIAGIVGKYDNGNPSYIADLVNSMHVGANAPLQFGDPAQMSKLMSSIIRHEQGYDAYSSSMVDAAAVKAVTLSNKTDIHVSGVGSPTEVANRVKAATDRSWQDMTRNFAGGVQ